MLTATVRASPTHFCQGYHGDLNETFFVGKIDKKSQDLVECAYRSLAAAIAIVKPGALYRYVRDLQLE